MVSLLHRATINKTVEITGHVHCRFMCKHIIDKRAMFPEVRELERFHAAEVTSKVTQGHWHWCHSIGHVIFY